MKEDLKHIFDQSACLTRRQMIDYVSEQMAKEEAHAVEHHMNACPLCSRAVDAVLNDTEALQSVEALNTVFLKEHFHLITPEIHLSSLTPAQPQVIRRTKKKIRPLWYIIAAVLALLIIWYLQGQGLL